MSITTASRYLFDLDFNAELRQAEEVETEPTITVYEHEAQMAALERRVRQEAHAKGREEAIAEGANALAEETERLTAVAKTFLGRLDSEIDLREERAVRITMAAAKKLARRLLEREPLDEIEAMFRACLAPMFDASHLVVRMNEKHVDTIRQKLEAVAKVQGFEGRLIFMGEEEMSAGDARIEWADGGLSRSQSEIEANIDQLLAGYLSAQSEFRDDAAPVAHGTPASPKPQSEPEPEHSAMDEPESAGTHNAVHNDDAPDGEPPR
ncbi:MAG: FliH/SctL family protein [Pseudomonadota bacterium]